MEADHSATGIVWDLADLYRGPDDPVLCADREWCLREGDRLFSAYADRLTRLSPEAFLQALRLLEKVEEVCERIVSFANLSFVTRTHDSTAGRLWQAALEFETEVLGKVRFFPLEWSKVPETLARDHGGHEALRPYRHHLQRLRQEAPFRLSAPEERILKALSLTGQSAWVHLFDKVMGQARFGREALPLAAVMAALSHPLREKRREAALDLAAGLEPILSVLTHICNALCLDKSLRDGLRSFPHWLAPMNLLNEVRDDQVEALVLAVTSRYTVVQDYYRLKRKILGLSELHDYDRHAPLPGGPHKGFSWAEARDLVLTACRGFSPEFADVATLFFERHWIHAAPLPGKTAGAFSHPTVPSCHPYICLHFTGTHRDVMTLAHELGHGVHQYLCRNQGLYGSRVPPILAETASVFAEMLVFEALLAGAGDERLAMLCGKLEAIFDTTFRQIALHRFEASLHRERRSFGELTHHRISDLWMSEQQQMYGKSLTLGDPFKTSWACVPHFFHRPGYVYAYAFAELMALSLFQRYRHQGSGFVPVYMEMLRRGAGAAPAELMKPFGIDLSEPAFLDRGLSLVEDLLQEAWRHTGGTSFPPG